MKRTSHKTQNATRMISPQFQLRAALALNNMAVRMMERCCYKQAFNTLEDAALLLQNVSSTETEDRDHVQQQHLRSTLERAQKRVLSPEKSLRYIPLRVLSHCKIIAPLSSAVFNHLSPRTVLLRNYYCFVRFDVDNDTSLLDREEFELPTACIIYNLAVASLCQAQCERISVSQGALFSEEAHRLRQKAIHLLTYAQSFLETLIAKEENDIFACLEAQSFDGMSSLTSCPALSQSFIGLSALVLLTLIPSLEGCGQFKQAAACLDIYLDICMAFETLHGSMPYCTDLSYSDSHSAPTLAPAA